LRSEGVDEKLGGVNRFTSVAHVIDNFQNKMIESSIQDAPQAKI
jgi:hypothetical protein